jgi:hypothetical protein
MMSKVAAEHKTGLLARPIPTHKESKKGTKFGTTIESPKSGHAMSLVCPPPRDTGQLNERESNEAARIN